MSIKKRTSIPPQSVQTDFSRKDDEANGRSPELQGQRYDVWQFIRDNPMCIRDDVSKALGLKASTATARVKELIDLGYVVEPPGATKVGRSGVKGRCLVLSARKAGGVVNDRVRVMVTLTIDCNGVYGASAYVIGGLHQTGAATPILSKPLTLTAPPAASYAASLDPSDVAPVSRLDTQQHASQIIDADYEILRD
jgi:hypothetical protein